MEEVQHETASRIPLQRKLVPHSYMRRRLQNILRGTAFGSPNTNIPNQQIGFPLPDTSNRQLADDPNRLAMTGYAGAVYYADVTLGSDAYRLIVDTGSTDTWVSCYVYDATRCAAMCPRAALNITYGSGTVCVATEILPVRLGSVVIRDYGVGVALSPIARPSSDGSSGILLGHAQGILGLGYPALATIESVPGYFVKFLKRFSVYFAPRDRADGSFLLLNAVDDDLIEQLNLVPYTLPLKKTTHWTVGLTGFRIQGQDASMAACSPMANGSCDAIIDTGTTLIVMPPQVFRTFVTTFLLPAGCHESQLPESKGMYICGRAVQLPTLQFTFAERNFYLPMEDYIQRTGSVFYVELQASVSTFQALQQSWVLGGTFLKKFYSSYEVARAVVFYCEEGRSCDQNGTASRPDDVVLVSAPVASGSNGSENIRSTGTPSSSMTHRPSDAAGQNDTLVSMPSSNGNTYTVTIAVLAAMAGLAVVVAMVFFGRKLYRKRQSRKHETLAALEIETVASSGAVESNYAAGAALTPSAVETR